MASPKMTIADLPDELLLHVISFLDMHHLLQEVRAVCRRWRALAVDQEVWKLSRHRSINLDRPDQGSGLSPAVWAARNARLLRLAPRLDFVVAGLDTLSDAMAELLCNTQCAFRKLSLSVWNASTWPRTLPLALRILRHLAPSLRELDLEMGCDLQRSLSSEGLALLQQALNMQGLEYLKLSDVQYAQKNSIVALNVTLPGLAYLMALDLGYGVELWLICALVKAHRSTLTALRLSVLPPWPQHKLNEALAQCTQLRKLSVPASVYLPDILSRLPNLTYLELEVPFLLDFLEKNSFSGTRMKDWENYFQSAVGLRFLGFRDGAFEVVNDDTVESLRTWLRALASSGRAALETLGFPCYPTVGDMAGLERVLAGLPRLRDLSLGDAPSWGLLKCISQDSAPSLEWISSTYCNLGDSSMNLDPEIIRRLLARHPKLHLSGHCFCIPEVDHLEDPESCSWVCGVVAPEHPTSPCRTCHRVSAADGNVIYWMSWNRPGGFWTG